MRGGGQDEHQTVLDDRALVPYDRAEHATVADPIGRYRRKAPGRCANIGPIRQRVLDLKIRHTYPVVIGDLGAVVIAADEVTIPIDRRGVTIGRGSDADIQIPGDALVSRLHAKLTYNNGILRVEDLASTNGTYLNGREVRGRPTLVGTHSRLEIGTGGASTLRLSY
ncbi:FHA domain-containing protein [archaeon]|nr:FHA domain-containing protein [archaeon]MBT4397104.1 FHA domain-containing protein [archaeon]MBT4441169.1 FHA domain-containing protein [archaeon]